MASKKHSKHDVNLQVYESTSIVQKYTQKEALFPAEKKLIEKFMDQFSSMNMLDIGIGGGRTTLHFGPLVKNYIGVDYSETMVAACKKRFNPIPPNMSFECVDVRDLSRYKKAQFDLILFSYNGLDCITHIERVLALKEIRSLLKPGGYFCFSTHNLLSFGKIIFEKNMSSYDKIRRYVIWIMIRGLNGSLSILRKKTHAIVRDDGDQFKLNHYYINPEFQVEQLLQAGFIRPQLFGKTGEEIYPTKNSEMQVESWIYFLTKVP